MPIINLLQEQNTERRVIRQDIYVGDDPKKALITRIVQLATSMIKIASSTDANGLPAAPGTGDVTLEIDLEKLTSFIYDLHKTDHDTEVGGFRDGQNLVFTLTSNYLEGSTNVYVNGVRQYLGVNADYTETGSNVLTFNYPPREGDVIAVDYLKL